jgi:hypothetical protein
LPLHAEREVVKRIRPRLTYANAMSTIAVFLVLGGATAFAALGKHTVGAGQLKKNAVSAGKIRKGAVTGAKIRKSAVTTVKIRDHAVTAAKLDLSALPPVPAATTATNADTVDGQSVTRVFGSTAAGQTEDVATIAGFTLRATCQANDIDVLLISPAATGGALVAEGEGKDEGPVFEYDSTPAGTAAEIRLDGHTGRDNRYGETTFSGTTPGGTVISGDIGYDFNSFGETQPGACIVFGEVTSG